MQYGSFTHEPHEVTVKVSSEIVRSDSGYALRMRRRWDVNGTVEGDTQAEITAKMLLRDNAYSLDFQDAVLLDNSGGIALSLPNDGSLGGVRITRPLQLPDLSGAQWSTYLDYEFSLEAEYLLPESANGAGQPGILRFREQVSIVGGQPIKVLIPRPSGDPIVMTTIERPGYIATQSGSMTTLNPAAQIPPPIWPDKLAGPPQKDRTSPEVQSGVALSYDFTWRYDFISASELVGQPTVIL